MRRLYPMEVRRLPVKCHRQDEAQSDSCRQAVQAVAAEGADAVVRRSSWDLPMA